METNETQGIETPEVPTNEPAADSAKIHPAYEKLLQELPEAWHSKVTPFLQEQDRNFQQQLEKYTPFKQYVEQGVDPSYIDAGINVARALEEDPMQVFGALKTHLMSQGMLEEDAHEAAADMIEEEYGDDETSALKRELDALRSQTDALTEAQQQQELDRQTEIERNQLENEMGELKSRYQITDAHEEAIYNLMSAALNAGEMVSVAQAAQQLAQMVGGFTPVGQAAAKEQAPTIIGSAGGAGVPSQAVSVPKDDRGKREMLAQLFEDYRRANNA